MREGFTRSSSRGVLKRVHALILARRQGQARARPGGAAHVSDTLPPPLSLHLIRLLAARLAGVAFAKKTFLGLRSM